MGSRAVERWVGWGQWQLSTVETRTDWRSHRPVVLDVPSAAIFSLRRALAAQSLTYDFVDGGAVGCLLSARTSFSPLSLDSSAGEKVHFVGTPKFERNSCYSSIKAVSAEMNSNFLLVSDVIGLCFFQLFLAITKEKTYSAEHA